jgi:NAD(P)-dependent dehydrogenase (short-subunit alcohol dehydrogenase family)
MSPGRLGGYRVAAVTGGGTFNKFPGCRGWWRESALVRSMKSGNGKKRAVVTGAARGIGKAVARRLAAEKVEVLAVDIDESRLSDLAGDGCSTRVVDLSDPSQRQSLAGDVAGYDYLVNSAGMLRVKPIFEVTVEEWRTIQTVNAESVFFLCQGIGPKLNPGGAIVNLSSSSAKLATSTDVAAYAASKTTILSITRSFAYALADRPVRVNAICPGIVDTEMQDNFLAGVAKKRGITAAELDAQRKKAVPLGRGASAEECAGLIWFLLSDEAAYMTGQALNFTGGTVNW